MLLIKGITLVVHTCQGGGATGTWKGDPLDSVSVWLAVALFAFTTYASLTIIHPLANSKVLESSSCLA